MHKSFLQTGAVLAALSVALGAFAAHGLKKIAQEHTLTIFETGVRYQFYHVIALILTGILYAQYPNKKMYLAGILFLAGIFLFSGSLYALTFLQVKNMEGFTAIGAITPLGGLCFMAGWLMLALGLHTKGKTGR
ncbi:MAG: hypothetical protein ABS68_13565 [Niastella sp. SCN 39-18]|nr:DUF423 domain-containing protein [Sphingobacteriales bacterium]ODT50715.1 MAG: hypothetical protein ABS68_13565 [Niastella sp. SCN 39-18]OJW07488.1 MAG: hypothetical protein BGO53_02965 [Sphingobacteriales bacterium 39-19]